LISPFRLQTSCYRKKEKLEALLVFVERSLIASSFVQSPVEGEFSKTRMAEGLVYYGLQGTTNKTEGTSGRVGGRKEWRRKSMLSFLLPSLARLELTFLIDGDQSGNFSFEMTSAAKMMALRPLVTRSEWLNDGFVEGKVKMRSTKERGS